MNANQSRPIETFSPALQSAYFHFWQYSMVHGKKACKRHGVGAMREYYQRDNVVALAKPHTSTQEAGDQWRAVLAKVCHHCQMCSWSKK
jgi:hypothetical protein